MANCTECGLEMVKTDTKKKGMSVYKHKDPDAAKAKGCGVSFIPVRSKADGNQAPGASAKDYKQAVKSAKRNTQRTASQQPAGGTVSQQPSSPDSNRGFFDDIFEFVFGKK